MNTQNLELYNNTKMGHCFSKNNICCWYALLHANYRAWNCSASFSRTTSHFSCFMIIMPLKKWMVAICNGNLEKQTSFLMGSHFLENISIYPLELGKTSDKIASPFFCFLEVFGHLVILGHLFNDDILEKYHLMKQHATIGIYPLSLFSRLF